MTALPFAKTRILVISDTHQRATKPNSFSNNGAFRPPFPQVDVLLHSGDLTMTGTIKENQGALQTLKEIPAELKLVIAGNHDLTLHRSYYLDDKTPDGRLLAQRIDSRNYDQDNVDIVESLWTGDEAKAAGVTYLTKGLHTFSLSNGAKFTIYVSPWQPEFFYWAFNYPHDEDRWNPPELVDRHAGNRGAPAVPAPPERDPHPIPDGVDVDVVMTHGPPWKHLDECSSGDFAGCPHLLRALDRVRPKLAVFGHIHEAWGAERVTWRPENEAVKDKEVGPIGEVTETIGTVHEGQRPTIQEVMDRRAAYIDVSSSSQRPLRIGKESILVNSSIMSLRYNPENAPWLVEVDLSVSGSVA